MARRAFIPPFRLLLARRPPSLGGRVGRRAHPVRYRRPRRDWAVPSACRPRPGLRVCSIQVSMAACAQLLDRLAAADEAAFIVAWIESVLGGRSRIDSSLAVRLLRAYREVGRLDRARSSPRRCLAPLRPGIRSTRRALPSNAPSSRRSTGAPTTPTPSSGKRLARCRWPRVAPGYASSSTCTSPRRSSSSG